MPIPGLDQAIADVSALKKQIALLTDATAFLNKIKFEGQGKIIVSGAEFKINANTDLRTILNKVAESRQSSGDGIDASEIISGTLDGDRLPEMSASKLGGVPATGTPSGKMLNDNGDWVTVSGGTTPSGTGWVHVAGGVQDGAASTPTYSDVGADVSGAASVVQGNLNTHAGLTTTAHGGIVALTDSRLTDARTPLAHNQDATTINSGLLDGDRLPAFSSTKKAGVPATGTPSGKYLKDDGTWATPAGGSGLTQAQVLNLVFSF
jgi:hypothetical protein